MSFNDLMIDLESLGTTPNSVILSGAFVYFDRLTGEVGDTIYEKFLVDKGLNEERYRCADTLEWWDKQDQDIYAEAKSGTVCLGHFLTTTLPDFYKPKTKVWGNGATFDVAMLEDAIRQAGGTIPWKFWDIRDVRTVKDLAEGLVAPTKCKQAHNPVADCENQIKYVCKMIRSLRG